MIYRSQPRSTHHSHCSPGRTSVWTGGIRQCRCFHPRSSPRTPAYLRLCRNYTVYQQNPRSIPHCHCSPGRRSGLIDGIPQSRYSHLSSSLTLTMQHLFKPHSLLSGKKRGQEQTLRHTTTCFLIFLVKKQFSLPKKITFSYASQIVLRQCPSSPGARRHR